MLFTEPTHNTKEVREKMVQMAFEHLRYVVTVVDAARSTASGTASGTASSTASNTISNCQQQVGLKHLLVLVKGFRGADHQ